MVATLSEELKRSEALTHQLDRRIDGLEVSSAVRFRMAAGCLDMAHEHHKAIMLLLAHSLPGAALSMIRSQFEAYIRGVWLHQCATDEEVSTFTKGTLKHTFGELIKLVEQKDSFSCGVLSETKLRSYKVMCSFTHTGFEQVARRNKTNSIEPDYAEEELIDALNFSNMFTIMATIEIAHMCNRPDLSLEVLGIMKTITSR